MSDRESPMASNSQPPVQSYQSSSFSSRQDPLNLREYMMSGSRRPKIESLLQPTTPPPLVAAGGTPAMMLSPFPDFRTSFQGSPGAFQGFADSYDRTQLTSPEMPSPSFVQQHRGSTSNMSEGHDSASSALHNRPSISSSTDLNPTARHEGIDALETNTSPDGSSGFAMGTAGDKLGQGEGSTPIAAPDGASVGRNESATRGKKDEKQEPPPWSEMKTKAGKERKRLPLACIACRRKKIRCSGEKPACRHCLRSRIPCVYKVSTRKAAPRTDYMAMLDKRLKRMEERVIKLIPKDSLASASAVGRAIVKPALPLAPVKATGGKKRPAEEAFGDDLDEWAKAKQAQPNIETSSTPLKGQDAEESGLLTEGAESLPSKEIQQHLAEVYFDYVYGQSYPLLHKPSFMRKLAAGTVPPVLILAVCTISARFSSHPQVRSEPAFLRGEAWASVARDIALRRYDTPNITILIVYLLLGLHEFGTCQGGRSWMFGGMAQRMAFALQLHKDLDHDPVGHRKGDQKPLSSTDREIRRRTMWSCFLMDRFNSSGTERPMFVNEQFVEVKLPIREHYFQMEISGPTEDLDGTAPPPVPSDTGQPSDPKQNMGVAAYLIRLVALWGRLVRYMNLGGKERDEHPMWSEKSAFQELKSKAHSFKETLPESLQYNADNLKIHASEKTANQFIFLHIVYNQIVLCLNRIPLPSITNNRPKDMPPEFFSESVRATFDAANQISALVNEAMDHLVVAPFAGYCAFVSSTVHIQGVFSKSPKLEATSKQNLAYNVRFLTKMKKHWGMFHYVAENLKELYRHHADAVMRGSNAATAKGAQSNIFQYGDWFDRYPHGVSKVDYEDPAAETKKEPGTDAVLGQKSDLQSVEEFFATLSPPSKAKHRQRMAKRSKPSKSISQNDAKSSPASTTIESQPAIQNVQPQQQQANQIPMLQDAMSLGASPTFFDHNSPQNFAQSTFQPDLSLLQPQMPQPDMLSQLDGPLALSSYAGMDATTVVPQGNAMWNFNFGGLDNSFISDPSMSWYLPFNLDPPDMVDDPSIFGAAQGYGFGFDTAVGPEEAMQVLDNTALEVVPELDEGAGRGGG